jgi:membrane protein YdbS with pleckstrin-like domain
VTDIVDSPSNATSTDRDPAAVDVDAAAPAARVAVDEAAQPLDPRVVRVHEIGLAILLGALLVPTFASAVIGAAMGDRRRWVATAIAAAVALAGAVTLWLLGRRWAHASYRHTSYRLSAGGFEIRRGVWWRTVVNVPRSRIQHTDVTQGPLQRAFELATLVVYTAGAEHAKIDLAGLAFTTAMALRNDLLAPTDAGADDDAIG